MKQLALFDPAARMTRVAGSVNRLDDDTENLLAAFRDARLVDGAHLRSVRREIGQLRALLRAAEATGRVPTLGTLIADIDAVAEILREPQTAISRSTGRDRLRAAQRLIQIAGPTLRRDPSADLIALDALLPTRRPSGWYATGALVAGTPGRPRRRGPTLDASDLRRIIDAAGASSHRDRALVALHCFSGLRPEVIVRLCWEDLDTELIGSGHYGLTVAVARGGRNVKLFLPGPAREAWPSAQLSSRP